MNRNGIAVCRRTVSASLVKLLRSFGHDVCTVQESGNAGLPDPDILEFAIISSRTVLTQNRRDFKRLHQLRPDHAGIIVCTEDRDLAALATRIERSQSKKP